MLPPFARRRSIAEEPSATSNTSKPVLRSIFVTARRKGSSSSTIRTVARPVYDGPYRYSARARDINPHWESKSTSIDIFSSSHLGGISRGFHINLTPRTTPEAYAYYRDELLALWASGRLRIHAMVIIAGSSRSKGRLAPEMTLTIKRRVCSMWESIAAARRVLSAAVSSPTGSAPNSV